VTMLVGRWLVAGDKLLARPAHALSVLALRGEGCGKGGGGGIGLFFRVACGRVAVHLLCCCVFVRCVVDCRQHIKVKVYSCGAVVPMQLTVCCSAEAQTVLCAAVFHAWCWLSCAVPWCHPVIWSVILHRWCRGAASKHVACLSGLWVCTWLCPVLLLPQIITATAPCVDMVLSNHIRVQLSQVRWLSPMLFCTPHNAAVMCLARCWRCNRAGGGGGAVFA
jgi:hypothetical protein